MTSIGLPRRGGLAGLLAAAALLCPAMSAAALQTETAPQIAAPLQVVISGSYLGPKLWRVSKDGHALWLLGT
ncbi:MAG: hypothetical protein WBV35_03765, partial [Steroidobacteraceae bacterium]